MRKKIILLSLVGIMLLASCASSGSGNQTWLPRKHKKTDLSSRPSKR